MGDIVAVENMPDVVHEPYAFLLDKTEVEPTVERNGYGRMLLTHLGERTKMTIAFRLDGRSWRWAESKLYIDGERKPNSGSWDQYVAIYKDPDNGRRNFVPDGAKKAKIPASRPIDEQYAPKQIADTVGQLRKMIGKETVTVTPTITSDGLYLVTITDSEDGGSFLYVFENNGSGVDKGWTISTVLVVTGSGYDITNMVGPDIEGHLMGLLGAQSRAAQVPTIPGGSVQQGAASNATMVRKATVFRV